jgi:transposase-like protein
MRFGSKHCKHERVEVTNFIHYGHASSKAYGFCRDCGRQWHKDLGSVLTRDMTSHQMTAIFTRIMISSGWQMKNESGAIVYFVKRDE